MTFTIPRKHQKTGKEAIAIGFNHVPTLLDMAIYERHKALPHLAFATSGLPSFSFIYHDIRLVTKMFGSHSIWSPSLISSS
jgi:hypothetical protein